jgi:hypothetical protein
MAVTPRAHQQRASGAAAANVSAAQLSYDRPQRHHRRQRHHGDRRAHPGTVRQRFIRDAVTLIVGMICNVFTGAGHPPDLRVLGAGRDIKMGLG